MVFSSIIFIWIFFPIVFIGNFLCQKIGKNKAANIFLLIASLFFYAWGEPIYIVLMIASIFINWIGGLFISKLKFKKTSLFFVVISNLGILGYFKYADMLISTINKICGSHFENPKIALPIGISFFTFQALSYVVDVYRKECQAQHNIIKLALYISFFPQLIAGPIVKYKDIAEYIDKRKISLEQTAEGIIRFSYGLGKKVLIANVLAASVDQIYSANMADVTWQMAWMASLMYTLQIYYDFSGYSDMAIGLGKMFGFTFKENFNYPYLSCSIREFWRRWHISLSSWFKDYVYIPLGGNRGGGFATYRNLLFVFFLTGLWHGASWNFVFWGMLHGFFMIGERLYIGNFLDRHKIFSLFYTFFIVNFAWVFFRIEDIQTAFIYIQKMIFPWYHLNGNYSVLEFVSSHTICVFTCGLIGMGIIQNIPKELKRILGIKWQGTYCEVIFCAILVFLSLISLASNTYNPFIYFRF